MDWAVIVMLLATGFDVGTTAHNLNQGGCYEANPLLKATHMDTPVRIALFEGGVSVGLVWTFGHTKKHQPKLTRAVALGIAASHTAAGVWNLNQNCKR